MKKLFLSILLLLSCIGCNSNSIEVREPVTKNGKFSHFQTTHINKNDISIIEDNMAIPDNPEEMPGHLVVTKDKKFYLISDFQYKQLKGK